MKMFRFVSHTGRQAIKQTEHSNDLLKRLAGAYIRETTGGVASVEEYDEAMKEESDSK